MMMRGVVLAAALAGLAVTARAADDGAGDPGDVSVAPQGALCLYEPCKPDGNGGEGFELPALGYPTESLEPNIDNKTMTLHYGTHFAGYTRKMNAAMEKMANASMDLGGMSAEELLAQLASIKDPATQKAFRNNGGGFVNHKIYFQTMKEGGQTEPGENSTLGAAIDKAFGNFSAFQDEMSDAAMSVFGSGWAYLAVDPATGEVSVVTVPNQDTPLSLSPPLLGLLGLDVWEHAYYLKNGPKRGDYVGSWWDVVDFAPVEAAYEKLAAR